MRTVVVTGSRVHSRPWLVHRALWAQLGLAGGAWLRVRHGGCPTGADVAAAEWAAGRGGVVVDARPASWDECGPRCPAAPHRRRKRPGDVHHPGLLPDYCPGAGPRRNAAMVAAGADLVLAFPEGASYGTWNCVRAARAAGVPVEVIR